MGQMGLFTRAELTTMRDRTRRRNYSAEAEEFRREHARHREWGLTQRHARKLSRLYGSTANAAAAFQRRADELTSSSARAVAPTSPEPIGPEPPGLPEPVGPKVNRSEQPEPKQIEPEQAEPEQPEPEQIEPEQAEPEQPEPEGMADAASASGPSGPSEPGNAGRRPDHRFCSSRPARHRPRRPATHPGPARKGPHRPESTRHIRPTTGPESPKHPARRHKGTTGVKNARRRRRTPLFTMPETNTLTDTDTDTDTEKLPRTYPTVISATARRRAVSRHTTDGAVPAEPRVRAAMTPTDGHRKRPRGPTSRAPPAPAVP
ncbi:hypothetical protein DMB66_54445 [Actinoplanes sp. ATCC 53533]|nr:hypothetical protein DMB66_54445 [Actinoplanes sp. ATCC 53533]